MTIQLNDEEEGEKTNCRASVEADASVDVFWLFFISYPVAALASPCFMPLTVAFLFLVIFHYNGCIPSVEFYSFVYISLLYQLLWCGHGREGLRVWLSLGTRNMACGVEGGFFWAYCWAQVCRIGGIKY